ncbi:MAG: molybdopterin molybdotransferase MoeA [Pseudorhodoplanes sp.]|nr:molybdopterin molybdotransferase MoeA [Pseudorhodoplanes sp.]
MTLLPVADALARVTAGAAPLPCERVPLAEAHRRVLCEDIASLRTQPPEDVSAMDGYAVRAQDVAAIPAQLTVIGEVAAGRPFAGRVGPGQAARIFTGGVIPQGADCIVVQESAERTGERVTVTAPAASGRHIRSAGLDFSAGDVLLQQGRRLSGRDLSLAAAMNHATLPVHRRPKIAMIATGDELVMPGREPGPGQIVYSNGYSIAALAASEGAEVMDFGIVPDKLADTIAAIRKARAAPVDIILTVGGASVGDYDLIQTALASEGLALSFWKIAMRPGRPLTHGRLDAIHVLGLPGNPVSAYVCAVLFLVPLIRKLSGRADFAPVPEQARLGIALKANDERADYLRATLSEGIATPFVLQDSSMNFLLAQADCLVIRPPFAPAAKAGDACSILKLPF